MKVKAWGFLRNRGTDLFSGRVVPEGSVFTAEQLAVVAECAKKYGNGSTRMKPFSPYSQTEQAVTQTASTFTIPRVNLTCSPSEIPSRTRPLEP